VYYKAKDIALKNSFDFHLAAFVNKKGPFGVNNRNKNSSKFVKRYRDTRNTYHEIHAEADLILKLDYVPEKISVVRFLKDGTTTMAKPCIHCQHFLKHVGVKKVRYTNWFGIWEEMTL